MWEGSTEVVLGFLRNSSGDGIRRLQQMAGTYELLESKAADGHPSRWCGMLERLAAMQHRATQNYFRLLDANRALGARAGATPRTIGTILADSMEAERQRLGRELHTGVGQALAGIHVHVSLLEGSLPDPPERVRKSLHLISSLAATALEQVRGVSQRLYVPAWQARPLVEALRHLWDASGISEKFAATLDLGELSGEPPPEVRRAIYLVAQEGISNAIQHADARRVSMSLRKEGERLELKLTDDGSGFHAPPDAERPASLAGIGLRSMRDLARQLGGDLQARRTPEGATLSISIPVTHE